ncbi:MAG: DoxX family protein [Solirubrobacteraceae bacterium]
MSIGLAVLRWIVGGLFMGHGLQKLAGWFGGAGLDGTGRFFEETLEMKPGRTHAAAAGAAETGGGALVALGLATPLGASLISGTMLTAIRKVHLRNGVWVTDGGYEYNLVLIAALFAIAAEGPGAISLDGARGRRRWGLPWALASLAAGALGSTAALELANRAGAASQQAEESPAPAGAEAVQAADPSPEGPVQQAA